MPQFWLKHDFVGVEPIGMERSEHQTAPVADAPRPQDDYVLPGPHTPPPPPANATPSPRPPAGAQIAQARTPQPEEAEKSLLDYFYRADEPLSRRIVLRTTLPILMIVAMVTFRGAMSALMDNGSTNPNLWAFAPSLLAWATMHILVFIRLKTPIFVLVTMPLWLPVAPLVLLFFLGSRGGAEPSTGRCSALNRDGSRCRNTTNCAVHRSA